MTYILLNSGKRFDYTDLDNQTIDIEDVAHGLSNLCRYSGQVDEFYSIAEHSVWCSLLAPPEDAWEALLHDGPESVMVDIPSPLKALLPDYKALEYRYEVAFAKQYGMRFPYPPAVKEVDTRIRLTEMICGFSCEGRDVLSSTGLKPYKNLSLAFMKPDQAKRAFLSRYHTLKAQR